MRKALVLFILIGIFSIPYFIDKRVSKAIEIEKEFLNSVGVKFDILSKSGYFVSNREIQVKITDANKLKYFNPDIPKELYKKLNGISFDGNLVISNFIVDDIKLFLYPKDIKVNNKEILELLKAKKVCFEVLFSPNLELKYIKLKDIDYNKGVILKSKNTKFNIAQTKNFAGRVLSDMFYYKYKDDILEFKNLVYKFAKKNLVSFYYEFKIKDLKAILNKLEFKASTIKFISSSKDKKNKKDESLFYNLVLESNLDLEDVVLKDRNILLLKSKKYMFDFSIESNKDILEKLMVKINKKQNNKDDILKLSNIGFNSKIKFLLKDFYYTKFVLNNINIDGYLNIKKNNVDIKKNSKDFLKYVNLKLDMVINKQDFVVLSMLNPMLGIIRNYAETKKDNYIINILLKNSKLLINNKKIL